MHTKRTQVEIKSVKPKKIYKGAKAQMVHSRNKNLKVHP
jgi:hypothetical protein